MNKEELSIRLSHSIGNESNPCAIAMNDILETFLLKLKEHMSNEETLLMEVPAPTLIIMIVNNIFLNWFLLCFNGEDKIKIQAADEISTKLKETFMDCIQKIVLTDSDEQTAH